MQSVTGSCGRREQGL
ncbi:unnamed protein product [Lathyrus sativus]|nr:unnamed protein product [Lathyrus sativus]